MGLHYRGLIIGGLLGERGLLEGTRAYFKGAGG